MPELILAIDVGTTSTRAAVFAPGGGIAGASTAPLASASAAPGQVEQDAEAVWNATRATIAAALSAAGRTGADIAALGLTTQRASAVIWDRTTGEPLSPLVVWSDLRGTPRARELGEAGYRLAPQQAAAKLEGMMAALDGPPSRCAWGALDSYLLFRLTAGAAHVSDRSQAWPTGYLDLADLNWNERLIDHQGLDRRIFPKLVDTWGAIGLTARGPMGAEIPIAADIADQQGALLAHGSAVGTAKITFGTSGTLDIATGEQLLFPGPGTPPMIVSSVGGQTSFCIEGMVLSAGKAVDWLREAMALGDHAAFDAAAGSVSDAAGAAFLPALQGLGAPMGDPNRRGAIVGLTASVSRAHLARAALEGLAFRAREIVDHVYANVALERPAALGIDGGLSRSGVFLQILADLLGVPVRRHVTPEATLLGAAMAAGRGAGLLTQSDEASMIRFEPLVTPRLDRAERDQRFATWRAQVYG